MVRTASLGNLSLLRPGNPRNPHQLEGTSSPPLLHVGCQEARGTPSGVSTTRRRNLLLLSGKWASGSLPKIQKNLLCNEPASSSSISGIVISHIALTVCQALL